MDAVDKFVKDLCKGLTNRGFETQRSTSDETVYSKDGVKKTLIITIDHNRQLIKSQLILHNYVNVVKVVPFSMIRQSWHDHEPVIIVLSYILEALNNELRRVIVNDF